MIDSAVFSSIEIKVALLVNVEGDDGLAKIASADGDNLV